MPGNKQQQSRCSSRASQDARAEQQGARLASTRAAEQSSESRKRCRRKDTDTARGCKGLTSRRNVLHYGALQNESEVQHETRKPCTCERIQRGTARSPRGLARCEAQDAHSRARAHKTREGTHTGEAGSASGRRVSRMSAPNLGAHRTPTRPSRQHATYSGFTAF